MTTTNRPHSLTADQVEDLKMYCRQLGGDIASRKGKTAALLYRAADQRLRGIRPATRNVRFTSLVAGEAGPTIGQILDRARLEQREAIRERPHERLPLPLKG